MITPLRRRHRWLAPVSFALGLVGLLAGVAARPADHVARMRPAPDADATTITGQAIRFAFVSQDHDYKLELIDEGGARRVRLTPRFEGARAPIDAPDLLLYGNFGADGESAQLIGPASTTEPTTHDLPDSVSEVTLYSLGHAAVVERIELPGKENADMGHAYQAVQWNRQKKRYDLFLALGVVLYMALFVGVSAALRPEATAETLMIRALGTCSFLLLHVVLAIGPLARIDARWLPLLYNRRHLGVTMCGLAFLHGALSLVQFHAFGDVNPFISLLTSNTRFDSLAHFPFQPLGAAALVILVLMAATSHDFWLANLTAPVWKALHMLVYVAYALILLHVALGVLQAETSPLLWGAVAVGALGLLALHSFAALKDARSESEPAASSGDWLDACAVDEVPEGRAKIVLAGGERIAIFRDQGRLSALSGVCQHQNGPLGEGRVVDGLVVCPWHGYQYMPSCGCSPEPFHEKVPTFQVRVAGDRVLVDPRPLPLGTETEPVSIDAGGDA